MKSSRTQRNRGPGSHRGSAVKLEKKNMKGETQLQRAVIRGDVQLTASLLNEGADANCFDNFGWSPLHEACNAGEVNMIQVLVDHPSTNVDSCGGFEVLQMGLTSLHDAAGNGHTAACKVLVGAGANTSLRDADGLTALETAEAEGFDATADYLRSVSAVSGPPRNGFDANTGAGIAKAFQRSKESAVSVAMDEDSTPHRRQAGRMPSGPAKASESASAAADAVFVEITAAKIRAVKSVLHMLYTENRTDSVKTVDVSTELKRRTSAYSMSQDELRQALSALSRENAVMVTIDDDVVRI